MDKGIIYNEPSTVSAVDGTVEVDGPDAVDVALTPEAAEETSDRLLSGALKARGQARLKGHPHRAKDYRGVLVPICVRPRICPLGAERSCVRRHRRIHCTRTNVAGAR